MVSTILANLALTDVYPRSVQRMLAMRENIMSDEAYFEAEKAHKELMATEEKALNVQSVADAEAKVSDIEVVGNGDTFALLCKASSKSQGWMKSAKAMETPTGCVVQVTTQNGDNVAEALTFVPGVKIAPDVNGGRKLVIS